MPNAVKEKTRLDFRVTTEKKRLIEQAANLSGQSVSDFAVSVLIKTAHEVIERHHQTQLSNQDRELFLSLIESDAEPSPELKKALKNFQRRVSV